MIQSRNKNESSQQTKNIKKISVLAYHNIDMCDDGYIFFTNTRND